MILLIAKWIDLRIYLIFSLLIRIGFLYFYSPEMVFMNKHVKIYLISSYFLAVILFQACKTDEFKFGEITIKEDWAIDVISPLFIGKGMEFRDFVYDWKQTVPNSPAPFTVLKYENNKYLTIPTNLIFNPSAVIDSFPLYIQGSYSLTKVELIYTVINGSPFPLNLQMQFFKKENRNELGPPVLPPPFGEANFGAFPVIPDTTVHHYQLDSLQLESFNKSDRVKFTSWYNQTDFIIQNDTVSAHYPIDISIVLVGVVQSKNED